MSNITHYSVIIEWWQNVDMFEGINRIGVARPQTVNFCYTSLITQNSGSTTEEHLVKHQHEPVLFIF